MLIVCLCEGVERLVGNVRHPWRFRSEIICMVGASHLSSNLGEAADSALDIAGDWDM